jgi:hypothetical protein
MRTKTMLAATMSVAGVIGLAAAQASAGAAHAPSATKADDAIHFKMLRSTATLGADCLAGASANVTITPQGQVESMNITARNLPPNREFDLFVLQSSESPFGEAWYQGDLDSDSQGNAHGHYAGRFNIETFLVAPGPTAAPVVHPGGTFPDASSNTASAPIHMFHLGLWFGSPAAAAAAGCPTTLTPFNGDHRAGIQALSTREFAPLNGPLRSLQP